LPRGHAALAFVDVGVGFADRAAVVVAVGFLRIYGFYSTKKSGYNMYKGWTQTDYQNKHYNINPMEEET
jgi:hypothetical protein